MLNTAPSRSLARRARQLLLAGYIVVSIGIFIAALGLVLLLVPIAAPGTQAEQFIIVFRNIFLILGAGTGLAGLLLAARAVTRRVENDLALKTGNHLAQFLDERYRFIRNINQPELGYIDAVLVGPPGVLVFRIMDSTGVFFNEKTGWMRKDNQGDWTPVRVNPTKECIVDINATREFLKARGLGEADVFGVVVFTVEPPQMTFTSEEEVVPVAYLSGLVDRLSKNYLSRERLAADAVNQIEKLLLNA